MYKENQLQFYSNIRLVPNHRNSRDHVSPGHGQRTVAVRPAQADDAPHGAAEVHGTERKDEEAVDATVQLERCSPAVEVAARETEASSE